MLVLLWKKKTLSSKRINGGDFQIYTVYSLGLNYWITRNLKYDSELMFEFINFLPNSKPVKGTILSIMCTFRPTLFLDLFGHV